MDAQEAFVGVARKRAQDDFYFFVRWLFLKRRGFKWLRGQHHKAVCDALTRVYTGQTKRLIINIPPRYSKTELLLNWVAWCLGRHPDAEFILTSYASGLATTNAWLAREMVQHEEYRAIFPAVELNPDKMAQNDWRTLAGGVVYAAGAGGTITGYGAGKNRPGFGGCFPYETRVWTERGLIPIGRIVRERLPVRVWAYDYKGGMALRPVTAWHDNPPNAIVRVRFDDGASVECTPDHRFWTENRGWVRADSLCVDDRLPRVHGAIQRPDDISVNADGVCGGLEAAPIAAASAVRPIVQGDGGFFAREDGAVIGGAPAFAGNGLPAGNAFPRFPAPYLVDDHRSDTVSRSDSGGAFAPRMVDGEGLRGSQNGNGVALRLTEAPVGFAIRDVSRAGIVAKIAKLVVERVAVAVAYIRALRTLADKRQQHKRVDGEQARARVAGKVDAQVAGRIGRGLENPAAKHVGGHTIARHDAAGFAAHAPVIADTVKPLITGHRKPTLVEFVRHDEHTFCLTVDGYNNFTIEQGVIVKNCIIIDDPHKPDEANSNHMRQSVLTWFQTTLESRKNSPDTPIILIMQRLHQEDLAGWLLDGGNGEEWEHVSMPALDDAGNALWPEKHSAETLRRMESANRFVFAGQYQQRPVALGGNLVRGEWFQTYSVPPKLRWRAIYADTAQKTAERNDYSVFECWGYGEDGKVYLLDLMRGKWEAPELERRAVAFWQKHAAADTITLGQLRAMKVEDKVSGTGLIQSLRAKAQIPIQGITRTKDKYTRLLDVLGYIEAGYVMLPAGACFVSDFVAECEAFSADMSHMHDDQVDPMMDAIGDMLTAGNTVKLWEQMV